MVDTFGCPNDNPPEFAVFLLKFPTKPLDQYDLAGVKSSQGWKLQFSSVLCKCQFIQVYIVN